MGAHKCFHHDKVVVHGNVINYVYNENILATFSKHSKSSSDIFTDKVEEKMFFQKLGSMTAKDEGKLKIVLNKLYIFVFIKWIVVGAS